MGLKMAKNVQKIAYVGTFFAIFRPITTIKTLKNIFIL